MIEPTLGLQLLDWGLEVIDYPIEALDIPNDSFDVVVSYEVIEHVFSPSDFLSNIRRLLKNNGLLILSCPNGEGFDVQTLGVLSDTIDHEHLNYFNPESIRVLLEANHFIVRAVSTPGKLDAEIVRNKVLDEEFDISGIPWLKYLLIDQWETQGQKFQNFLSDNCLSSHMVSVAQKIER